MELAESNQYTQHFQMFEVGLKVQRYDKHYERSVWKEIIDQTGSIQWHTRIIQRIFSL